MSIKNTLFKTLSFLQIPAWVRSRKLKQKVVTVLSLHRINAEKDPVWQAVSPQNFKNLLRYVSRHYQVCHFRDIAGLINDNNKRPLLVLSFDDGYADFMEFALPLLQKYQLKANHNLVYNCLEYQQTIWTQHFNQIFNHLYQQKPQTSIEWNGKNYPLSDYKNWYGVYQQIFAAAMQTVVNQRNEQVDLLLKRFNLTPLREKMMSWEDAKECLATGLVEFGSHTISHDILPSITDQEQLKTEIYQSKRLISEKLGEEINIFALPNGQNNPQIIKYAQDAGYNFLLETGDCDCRWENGNKNPLKIIPRINVEDENEQQIPLRVENIRGKIRSFFNKK